MSADPATELKGFPSTLIDIPLPKHPERDVQPKATPSLSTHAARAE